MRTNSAVGALAIAAVLGALSPSCTCLGPKPGERGPGAAGSSADGGPSVPPAKRDDGAPFLSWFETAAAGKECAWVKSDPIAKSRTVITTVPEECPNATVAWSPDGAKAVLWFPSREPEGVSPRPRLREVTIAGGATQPVEIPVAGTLSEIAYDPRGSLIALTESEIPEKEMKAGKATFDGTTYDIPEEMDGLPVLVHAWRREGSGWKRFETKVSDTGWDLAVGAGALGAAKTLSARSTEALNQTVDGDDVANPTLKAKLDAAAGPIADDEFMSWLRVKSTPAPVYVLQEESEFVVPLATVLFADGEKLARAPGLGIPPADPIAVQLRGPWMLVTRLGEGSAPHLYDLRTRALVWKSDTAHVTTFWPK